VLSLLTPDLALLIAGEKLNVPLAGPVSFFGFMLLGPAVLIVLRIYLQIYVEHQRRLDRIAQTMPAARTTAILTPDKNPLLRGFRGFTFYLLLPLAIFAFWWKAAVYPEWGLTLAVVTVVVIVTHLTLLFRRLSWTQRAVISLGVTILAVAVTLSFGVPLRRPCGFGPPLCLARSFNLHRANLSDQWLPDNFENADLSFANLSGADLSSAILTGANLILANLSDAHLTGGRLNGAYVAGAKLTGAELGGANLTGADLLLANLSDATSATLTSATPTSATPTSPTPTSAAPTSATLTSGALTVLVSSKRTQRVGMQRLDFLQA
jgi:hypothetical protein